jgi:hypothetical protein
MKRNEVYIAYAQSLFWAVLLITIAAGLAVLCYGSGDFIARRPPVEDALKGMVLLLLIAGFVATVASFLVFTLPQCFQAALSNALAHRNGRRGQLGVLLALPLTAVLTWYSYDYLTPSMPPLAIGESSDWIPFQHGITLQRYLGALIFQAPVTLFGVWYCDAVVRHVSRETVETVVVVGLIVAVVIGVALGSFLAVSWISNLTGRHQFWPY